MSDEQYPETGISQETRDTMYPDDYSDKMGKAFMHVVDQIMHPATPIRPIDRLNDHGILLDELAIMYEANMTIGGQQNRFNASVLRAAINVIRAL